jgi:hypothetical protein
MKVKLKVYDERAACSVHDPAVTRPNLSNEFFCIVIHESVM